MGIYDITPNYYSLSEKLVAAMIATGDCRAETMVKNNHEVMQYIFPLFIHIFLSSYYPALNLPNINYLTYPVKQSKQVRILSYGSNGLAAFSSTSFASFSICQMYFKRGLCVTRLVTLLLNKFDSTPSMSNCKLHQ